VSQAGLKHLDFVKCPFVCYALLMLLIKTSVRLSSIHGLGLFAAEPIRKGQAVWAYDSKIDSKVTQSEYEKFTESRRATISHFAYLNSQKQWIICGDGALFINHSDAPNCEVEFNEGATRALKDIPVGEEITLNYLS